MIPSTPQTKPVLIQSLGQVEQADAHTFKQEVTLTDGRVFIIKIHCPEDSAINLEKAKGELGDQIERMVKLADKLGLGKEDSSLQKIQVTNTKVFGTWKNEGQRNFRKKLLADKTALQNANALDPKIKDIEKKIKAIDKTIAIFNQIIPKKSALDTIQVEQVKLSKQKEFNEIYYKASGAALKIKKENIRFDSLILQKQAELYQIKNALKPEEFKKSKEAATVEFERLTLEHHERTRNSKLELQTLQDQLSEINKNNKSEEMNIKMQTLDEFINTNPLHAPDIMQALKELTVAWDSVDALVKEKALLLQTKPPNEQKLKAVDNALKNTLLNKSMQENINKIQEHLGKFTKEEDVLPPILEAAPKIHQLQTGGIEIPPVLLVESVAEVIQTTMPSDIKETEKQFNTVFNSALQTASAIEGAEKVKFMQLLNKETEIYEKLETASPQDLIALRNEMQVQSLKLKSTCERSQRQLFPKLEGQLVELTRLYNNTVEKRKDLESAGGEEREVAKLKALEDKMRAKITEYNAIAGNTSLTTNAFTATKSNVINFHAVVEKKLSLLEERASKGGKAKIERKLANAPTVEEMRASGLEIQKKLEKSPIQVVSIEEAKNAHRGHPELKWGASHLNLALTAPANWGEVRSALIKESRTGAMHVAVSTNTPLGIDERGGVPAGLRASENFEGRPANLIKTTSYIRTSSGDGVGEQVSFRGGQFPTMNAAREALEQIMLNLPEGQELEDLHINALLTPMYLTKAKQDKLLLAAHKENIMAAIDSLIVLKPTKADSLRKLRDQIAISNFGVNEGAVGEKRILGYRLKLGWHTSIADYSNVASQKLNWALHRKFESMEAKVQRNAFDSGDLDRLGAMLQVGQEMEAVWARNEYAEAGVGNNQFKLPSLWKTMDTLIGVICYTDCMSGKDRTGKVESNAQEYLDEINMNIADQKLALSKTFEELKLQLESDEQRQAWDNMKPTLTSACFFVDELESFHEILKSEGSDALKTSLKKQVSEKINFVKQGLGAPFMEEKRDIPRGFFNPGTKGIPTNTPKLETERKIYSFYFPDVAVSSMYAPKILELSTLEDLQRQAVNRRLSQLSGSLQVTQINTGKPGFKVEGGEPLARFSSGFDRDYVIYKIKHAKSNDLLYEFNKAAGLHEVDQATRADFERLISSISNNAQLSDDQKIQAWTTVLKEIEEVKMESLAPKAEVKA